MCSAVHQPGDVQAHGVAQDGGQEEGVPQALSPEVAGHQGREHEAHEKHRALVIPAQHSKDLSAQQTGTSKIQTAALQYN